MLYLELSVYTEETRVVVDESGELGSVQEEYQEKELLEEKLGQGSAVPCDVCVCVCV